MYIKNNELKHDITRLKKRNGFVKVGKNKRTLVNCLIGANELVDYEYEIKKIDSILNISEKPDIVSDLSTKRRKISESIWYKIVKDTPFVAATLPIYLVSKNSNKIDSSELLDIIIEQMENGVGMITIHPTANKQTFEYCKNRMIPITSRGGGIVIQDLILRDFLEDNVYLKILPEIIKYAQKHNVCISLGATFRSGNIFDSNDKAQIAEIKNQIELGKMISKSNVGVIIESPGHARPRDIIKISSLLKKEGFPIMPLGPIPTDIAIGMDHIAAAIGATIMGLEGCANIISTVTREEHTGGRPSIESTVESIRTAKIAAHIIDIHRMNDVDLDMSVANTRSISNTCIFGKETKYCDRCGELCPLRIR